MERISNPSEKITVIENRDILEAKLKEYKARFPHRAPEINFHHVYKIAILESLLKSGEVDKGELREELMKKYGEVDEYDFNDAWGVINDYVKTGGANLLGGTGLPENPQADITEGEIR